MSLYAVALRSPALPLLAPAAVLAAFSSRDSAPFLRSNPGFLGRRLTLEKARALAGAAAGGGFETILADEADLPLPPPALTADTIEIEAGGFRAASGGRLYFIPYDSVSVLAAAAYDAPAPPGSFDALKPALYARLAALAGLPAPAAAEPAKETFFRADIIGGDGPLRLLLKPETLDFSVLGKDKAPSSEANFRALLGRLSAPAFTAVKNHFLGAYLSGAPLAPHKTAGPEACDTGLSLLLLLAKEKTGR